MIELAFRKHSHTFRDHLISIRTLSFFPHCEIIVQHRGNFSTRLVSSPLVGGVRLVTRNTESQDWEHVYWGEDGEAQQRLKGACEHEVGKPYNYLGAVLMGFYRPPDRKKTWFCSELVAHILGLPNPHSYSPGRLYQLAKGRKSLTLPQVSANVCQNKNL